MTVSLLTRMPNLLAPEKLTVGYWDLPSSC